jgi:hypothetical protein
MLRHRRGTIYKIIVVFMKIGEFGSESKDGGMAEAERCEFRVWESLRTESARREYEALTEEERAYINGASDVLANHALDITFFSKPIGGYVDPRVSKTPPEYNWSINLGDGGHDRSIVDAVKLYRKREQTLDPTLRDLLGSKLRCNTVFILGLPTLTDFGRSEDDPRYQSYKASSKDEAIVLAKLAAPPGSLANIQEETRGVFADFSLRVRYPVEVQNIFLSKENAYLLHFVLQHAAMKFDPAYTVYFDGSLSGEKMFGAEKEGPTIVVVDEIKMKVLSGEERKPAKRNGSRTVGEMYEHIAPMVSSGRAQSFAPWVWQTNRGKFDSAARERANEYPRPPIGPADTKK